MSSECAEIDVGVLINLEHGIIHLLILFDIFFDLGQFWVTPLMHMPKEFEEAAKLLLSYIVI